MLYSIQIFSLNFSLILIGFFGIICNRTNILIVLLSIEILLLGVNLNFILYAVYLDDMLGQIFSLYIFTIAAAESAIGIALLVCFFRQQGSIYIEQLTFLKG